MKQNQVVIALLYLITFQIYSQSQMPLKTFISANKLEYIVILENKTFGFILK